MVENNNNPEMDVLYPNQKRAHEKPEQKGNIRMSLVYALLFDILVIFACISFICIFYVIGGIFLNPLLIFGTLVIILLFALIETMNLVEKNILEKTEGEPLNA